MKKVHSRILVALGAAVAISAFFLPQPQAAESSAYQTYEFATLRYRGKDRTHLIRPNGQVEFLGPLLSKVERVEHADERDYLMNIALNAAAKEGYEIAAMHPDIYILKRPVRR
jgi:hypothetical protein